MLNGRNSEYFANHLHFLKYATLAQDPAVCINWVNPMTIFLKMRKGHGLFKIQVKGKKS